MNDKLKPCPFCGGAGRLVWNKFYDAPDCGGERHKDMDDFYVACTGCNFARTNGFGNMCFSTRELAIAAWNTRHQSKNIDPDYAEFEAWRESAAQMSRNAEYYRGLVVKIGEMFGEAAYISDDGSKQQDVLCAKVPELVSAALAPKPEAKTATLEPLACLAAEGVFNVKIWPPTCLGDSWDIELARYKMGVLESHEFDAPTYAECESKARAYLEGLEDVKGGR